MKLDCIKNRLAELKRYQVFRKLQDITGSFLDTLERMESRYAGKDKETNLYYLDDDNIGPMITRLTGLTENDDG